MPQPIADWRNLAEYPQRGARLSSNRWAWEFLRRNPGYQDAWQSIQEIVAAILADNGGDESLIEDDPRFLRCEPDKLQGEDDAAWVARVGRGTQTTIDTWCARHWGLERCQPIFPDPFSEPLFVSFSGCPLVRSPAVWKSAAPAVLQPEMAFVIDFRKPVDGQIEALRRYAENHQKWLADRGIVWTPDTRNTRPEWSLYLRLLDAELAGVTDIDEIAAVLYKNQHTGANVTDHDSLRRRINKNQAEARALRDQGYLWIAASTPKRKNNKGSKNGSVS
jgi:hypothetical protein